MDYSLIHRIKLVGARFEYGYPFKQIHDSHVTSGRFHKGVGPFLFDMSWLVEHRVLSRSNA
jgi:hypothetical protein